MKKLALATAFVGLAVSAASANMVDTVNKSGFYLGINGGYGLGKVKIKSSASGHKTHLKLRGALYGVHAGYQHDMGRSVAGIELHGLMTDEHRSKTDVNGYHRTKRDYGFGAAVRMGYKVAPCWVAGIKLGYERGKFKNRYVPNGGTGSSHSTKHNGFVPGVYAEKLLNKHWMVGLEYSYALFKKRHFIGTNGSKITVRPSSNDFKVRLGYKF